MGKRAGISKNTLHNIEQGAHNPSAETLLLLFGVSELNLSNADLASPMSDWQPNSWVPDNYHPVEMTRELISQVSGPSDSIEQTFVYLDGQSAADWLSICSMESFADSFRKTRPLPAVAQQITRLAKGLPLMSMPWAPAMASPRSRCARRLSQAERL